MEEVSKEVREQVAGIAMELEKMAAGMGLKSRVVDSVSNIRKELQNASAPDEWDDKIQKLDEWVAYLKNKALPEEGAGHGERASKEEVLARAQEVLEGCRKSRLAIRGSYAGAQQSYMQELEREMHDLANVRANYGVVTSPSAFCGRFSQLGQKFDRQVTRVACEYIDEAGESYGSALQKVWGMLKQTGCGSLGPGSKEMYQKWDGQLDLVKQNQKAYAEGVEKGARAISEFGDAHAEPIQKIIAKKKRKSLVLKLLPVFIVLAAILFHNVGQMRQTVTDTAVQAGTPIEEAAGKGLKEGVSWLVKKAGPVFLLKFLLVFVLELALSLGLVWFLWIKQVDRMYKKSVCREAGGYLAKETEAFWKSGILKESLEKGMGQIEASLEQQCQQLFAEAFRGNAHKDGKKQELLDLCREWERVKCLWDEERRYGNTSIGKD